MLQKKCPVCDSPDHKNQFFVSLPLILATSETRAPLTGHTRYVEFTYMKEDITESDGAQVWRGIT